MASRLERSIVAVCEKHALTALSISYHPNSPGHFTAYVHRGAGVCSGQHADTVALALGKAIAELNARPVVIADEALPELTA